MLHLIESVSSCSKEYKRRRRTPSPNPMSCWYRTGLRSSGQKNDRRLAQPVPNHLYPGDGSAGSGRLTSADGQRFLMMYNVPDANPSTPEFGTTVLLIENWFEEFREKK